jgi:hypothetical protein
MSRPSIPTIAAGTGLSEKSVRRAIIELKTLGFIDVKQKPNRTNIYRLLKITQVPQTAVPEDEELTAVPQTAVSAHYALKIEGTEVPQTAVSAHYAHTAVPQTAGGSPQTAGGSPQTAGGSPQTAELDSLSILSKKDSLCTLAESAKFSEENSSFSASTVQDQQVDKGLVDNPLTLATHTGQSKDLKAEPQSLVQDSARDQVHSVQHTVRRRTPAEIAELRAAGIWVPKPPPPFPRKETQK